MDEADDEGFWSFVRRTRPFDRFSEETEEHIDKRQRRVCTRGFGVSYEWITEPHDGVLSIAGQQLMVFFTVFPRKILTKFAAGFPM